MHRTIKQKLWHPILIMSKLWFLWAQTLRNINMIGCLLGEEQRGKAKALRAKTEGMMCPALVELVCEALASSGRETGRSIHVDTCALVTV